LVIDSGKPCNRQTPHSHNFLTHDGRPPKEIAMLAKEQVAKYSTVQFLDALATAAAKTKTGFEVQVASGETFHAKKLIFATGIKDLLPHIEGVAECWGISVIHCPYCHGYEVRHEKTGILANGENAFEMGQHISNWTKDLTIFTNGPSTLTPEQTNRLKKHEIKIVEKEFAKLEHTGGHLQNIVFTDGTIAYVKAIYARVSFEQHCNIPEALGCELTDKGFLKTDTLYATTVKGIFACGDNMTGIRTVANAVATGTTTGIMVNRELIMEEF
jgi:thioredoxin reductase